MLFLYLLAFFVAGFAQEILITTYHRAVMTNRILVATILTMLIAVLGLLVMAEVTRKIFDPTFGLTSYLFVIIFAAGKGLGSYLSLKKLHKW